MDRQNRLLTVLAVILLALVAVVVIDKPKDGEEKPLDHHAPPTTALFDYKSEEITKLSLTMAEGAISFEKADNGWKMTAPKSVPVDQKKVADIVERLKTTKTEDRALTGAPTEYGLDEAQRIEVKMEKADGTAFTVYIGKDAPVGYRTYLSIPGKGGADEIRTASTKISDLFPREADDFRSKDLWMVSGGTAKRIKITVGPKETILRKDDHGWWLGDSGPRADEEKVSDWLSKASMVKVDRFLDGQDPATLGLDAPAAMLTVEDADGTHELKFGPRGPDGAPVLTPSGPVHVAAESMDLLAVDDFLSTKLMPVRAWQLDKMQIELAGKSVTWTRKDGQWSDGAGAASTLPDDLLPLIKNVTANRAAASIPPLGTPSGKIVLGEGETRSETITFGDLAGADRVARDEAGGPIFLVPQADLDAIVAKLP